MLDTTGQSQLILGGSQPIKRLSAMSEFPWLTEVLHLCMSSSNFGRAEQVLENTHHPGVGTSSEPCEQLGWEVLLSLLLA